MLSRPIAAGALVWLLFAATSVRAEEKPASDPSAPVSYYKQIRPIFQTACFGCHQPASAKGGLVMTNHAGLLKGGESGEPALVAGQPESSPLWTMIVPQGDDPPEMPREGAPLTTDQVALVRRWIVEGAKDDSPAADTAVYSAEQPPRYAAPPAITSVAISPDGQLLAVAGYHEVLLHKLDGEPPQSADPKIAAAVPDETASIVARLVGLSERIQSVVFSPDGKLLAAIGGSPARMGEIQLWDVATRKLVRSIHFTYDTLYGASFSPDGKLLAFGCGDNTLRAIEVNTGKQIFYQNTHTDWVMDTVFSKDASHLVSVSRDFSMKLNEVATQRFVDNITSITPGALKGGLHAVDRHPQRDELLIGGSDGKAKIYRMHRAMARKIGDDYNLIRAFESLPGRIYAVSYSPDGKQVAAGASSDGSGEVWVFNEADAKLIAKLEGIEGGIYTLAFTPDGRRIVSAGFRGEVFVHEAQTGKLLKRFTPVPLEKPAAG